MVETIKKSQKKWAIGLSMHAGNILTKFFENMRIIQIQDMLKQLKSYQNLKSMTDTGMNMIKINLFKL